MERRTLDEIYTLYSLEPDLRDIYVEGPSDRDLIKWILQDRDPRRTSIYEIDGIEITSSILDEQGLTPGGRSRVIALSNLLHANLPEGSMQATCVIDADLDGALGTNTGSRFLLHTDYADVDGYLATPEVLSKFLQLVLGVEAPDAPHILQNYFDILREPFLLRLSGQVLGVPLAQVDISGSCRAVGRTMELDRGGLLRRILDKSRAAFRGPEIEARAEELRPLLTGDPRKYMNGHDFFDLVATQWDGPARRRGLRDHGSIGRILRNGLDLTTIRNEPLFQEIRRRIQAP